ncbi:MAG: hypothetical protein HC796_09045 [Synechococcaceae cyanobacterium RL_1_2]|nr:hypothetical protein [Synechococcaceae cyanobacterium RL_1_2]
MVNPKLFSYSWAIALIPAMVLGHPPLGAAQTETIAISAQTDLSSQILTGTSGGSVTRDSCGITKSKPDHIITIQDRFNFLRIAAQTSEASSTLWIVSSDSNTGLCAYGENQGDRSVVELSGLWIPGTYDIYVGETATDTTQPFCLTLSDDYSGNDFSNCP